MDNCLIIPGKPSKKEYFAPDTPSPSNNHWFPWVQKQLLMKGVLTQVLEMPSPYAAKYAEWKEVLDIFPLDQTYTLVGHSGGAGFLFRYLCERKVSVKKLVLVALSFRPTGDDETAAGEFYSFEHDPKLTERISSIHIVYSQDDPVKGIKESTDTMRRWYPNAISHKFTDKGHFCVEEMHSLEFPELIEIITSP